MSAGNGAKIFSIKGTNLLRYPLVWLSPHPSIVMARTQQEPRKDTPTPWTQFWQERE